jgi:hypothetical protein
MIVPAFVGFLVRRHIFMMISISEDFVGLALIASTWSMVGRLRYSVLVFSIS